jgi:homocysteine S-methyltransferase
MLSTPHSTLSEADSPSVAGADSAAGSHAAIVLDGGLSNALEARGHDVSGPLWTARMLRDAPGEIAAVHRSYYRAGAQVATTASYQASVPGFVAAGVERTEAERLIARSVALARDVRDSLSEDGSTRWVAASAGPYGAVLADGSEYRGRYGLSRAQLREFHRPRLELLVSAGPDFVAVETIPDVDEAEVLVEQLDDLGVPAWISFSARGSRTCADQPLADAFAVAGSGRSVFAVGVNCCAPADVLPALSLAAQVAGKPAVAYPNAGAAWDASAHRWVGGSSFDPGLARDWVAAGAAYVGGCCRVGPREIATMAAAVNRG